MPVSWRLGPWLWPIWGLACAPLPPRVDQAALAALRRGARGREACAAGAPGPGCRLQDVGVVVGGRGLLSQDGGRDPLYLRKDAGEAPRHLGCPWLLDRPTRLRPTLQRVTEAL